MKRFSRSRKIGTSISAIFFFLGAIYFYLICTFPPPVQAPYKVWIPEGARIMPRDKVHPGTFRLDAESLGAIKERCKKMPDLSAIKVVYATSSEHFTGQVMREPGIYYWVPDGFGAYDYGVDHVPDSFPSWQSWLFCWRTISFNAVNSEFAFTFYRSPGGIILSVFFMLLSLFIMAVNFYHSRQKGNR